MAADLTAYVPRLLLDWEATQPAVRYRAIEGTLVFADVSGFTKLSERLARAGGKIGAEQMTDVINALFGELLLVAAARGGEMLKYGGDAVLLFFTGALHAPRGAAACLEMQRKLKEIGRVDTGAGVVRLRMSVGANSGTFDFFKVGESHEELIVAGPATTECVAMEAAADAGEILLSPATVALLGDHVVGDEKAGGRLLRRLPKAPLVDFKPLNADVDARRFVPPAIRAYLEGGPVEPDHRLSTVAFLHIMGIDRELRRTKTECVVERLHETLAVVQRALTTFGVSFLATDLAPDGTKVMAAAGAPLAVGDPEERMLRALREVQDACTPLAIRAGVHRGHVFSGDVGPRFRRTFTTIGDVTNTAARVMGQAKAGEVLALHPVLDRLRSECEVEELPSFMAKGKTEPLVPYRVGTLGAARSATVEDLPMIGRDRELAELLRLAAESTEPGATGVAVEVVGEAGSGKSRIIRELRARSGLPVIVVAADRYSAEIPFATISALVRHALDLPHPPTTAGLAHAVSGADQDLLRWLPLVGLALGIDVPMTPEVEDLDQNFAKAKLSEVLADLLVAARPRPTLWVIEDSQWMDAASREVLRRLLDRIRSQWLMVFAARTADEILGEGGRAITIDLAPLSKSDATALARAADPDRLLPDQLALVVERAGGNPLYLLELLRSWKSGQEAEALPDTIEELVQTRIDALDPAARRTLRLASVLGTTVDIQLLALAVEGLDGRVDLDWSQLGDFLDRTENGQLRFRQMHFRDVAYEGLPYRQRQRLHLLAGDAIESRSADPDGAAEVLSMHFEAARDHERSLRYSQVAAARAKVRFANLEAVTFLRRSIASARRHECEGVELAELWLELALMLLYAGLYVDAAEAARQGRSSSRRDCVLASRLVFMEGEALRRQGNARAALRRYQKGIALIDGVAGKEAAASRSRLLNASAQIRQFQARYVAAADLAAESAAQAALAEDEAAVALAHATAFTAHISLGHPDEAERFRELPLRVFAERGALWQLASFLTALGIAEYEAGRWDAAQLLYAEAAATATRAGDAHRGAVATNNRGEILSDQGRLDEAVIAFDEALAIWRPSNYRLGLAVAGENLGRACARAGEVDRALSLFDAAAQDLTALGATEFAAYAMAWAAEAAAFGGDASDALIRAAASRKRLPAGAAGNRLRVVLDRAEAAARDALGEADAAEALIARSVKEAAAAGLDYEVAVSLAVWQRLEATAALPHDAAETVAATFERFGVVGIPVPTARPA